MGSRGIYVVKRSLGTEWRAGEAGRRPDEAPGSRTAAWSWRWPRGPAVGRLVRSFGGRAHRIADRVHEGEGRGRFLGLGLRFKQILATVCRACARSWGWDREPNNPPTPACAGAVPYELGDHYI